MRIPPLLLNIWWRLLRLLRSAGHQRLFVSGLLHLVQRLIEEKVRGPVPVISPSTSTTRVCYREAIPPLCHVNATGVLTRKANTPPEPRPPGGILPQGPRDKVVRGGEKEGTGTPTLYPPGQLSRFLGGEAPLRHFPTDLA